MSNRKQTKRRSAKKEEHKLPPEGVDPRRIVDMTTLPSARLGVFGVRNVPNEEQQTLSDKARQEGATYPKKRFVYEEINRHLGERIFIALIGPRGVGKSTLLKQIHNQAKTSFYISLDTGSETDLFGLANELMDKGIKLLLIDEIHAYPNYGNELKKIYDFLPQLQVVFTSSSAISLHSSTYDLSRRVRVFSVLSLSFREFIFFSRDIQVQPLPFSDLTDTERCRTYYGLNLRFESLFKDYLTGSNYLFTFGQQDTLPQFRNMLDTIIERDLIRASGITLAESFEVRQILLFIGRSESEGISYSSISQNCQIAKTKVQRYVDLLEKAFVLKCILPKGTNITKEPKILFALPYRLLFKSYDDAIGALREDFFVDAISRLGIQLDYLKGTRGEKTPDYLVNDLVCEIGGRNKGRTQFKGFTTKQKIIFTHPGMLDDMRRPLFFVGMLE